VCPHGHLYIWAVAYRESDRLLADALDRPMPTIGSTRIDPDCCADQPLVAEWDGTNIVLRRVSP
jgi:hypothetical protein